MSDQLKNTGATLLEVVITLFIMSVGLLGLARLQSIAIKDSLETAQRSQTAWLVSEMVERIRANPADKANSYRVELSRENCSKPARYCSATLTECTPSELARFDIWDVFCGESSEGVLADSVESLKLSTLSISCDQNCSTSPANYNVSISWQTRATGNTSDPNTQQITMKVRP